MEPNRDTKMSHFLEVSTVHWPVNSNVFSNDPVASSARGRQRVPMTSEGGLNLEAIQTKMLREEVLWLFAMYCFQLWNKITNIIIIEGNLEGILIWMLAKVSYPAFISSMLMSFEHHGSEHKNICTYEWPTKRACLKQQVAFFWKYNTCLLSSGYKSNFMLA